MKNKRKELQGRIEALESRVSRDCGDEKGSTHSYACTCRELKFARMERALMRVQDHVDWDDKAFTIAEEALNEK